MKKYFSIILNCIIVICTIAGQYFNICTHGFILERYLYYTHLTNIIVMLTAIAVIVFEIRGLRGHEMPRAVNILRFSSATMITLTFVVFAILLTPFEIKNGNGANLLLPSNYFVHDIVPLLAIFDWCIFGNGKQLKKLSFTYTLIFPLAYMVFMLIRSTTGLTIEGRYVPYFFLDYKNNGWFAIGNGKIGVAFWIVILFSLVIALALGLRALAIFREWLSRKKASDNSSHEEKETVKEQV